MGAAHSEAEAMPLTLIKTLLFFILHFPDRLLITNGKITPLKFNHLPNRIFSSLAISNITHIIYSYEIPIEF